MAQRRPHGLQRFFGIKARFASHRVDAEPEAEYESVTVALLGLRYSYGAIATAATVAAKRRRGIYLLVPIVVPQSEPIDASMSAKERLADALIEEARLQIGNRLQGRWIKVRAGQFGRAVVEHAEATAASAIVMSIPPATSDGGIRRSIDTVMTERPCRVILQVDPESRTVAQLTASREPRA